jgi:hypothetical protein
MRRPPGVRVALLGACHAAVGLLVFTIVAAPSPAPAPPPPARAAPAAAALGLPLIPSPAPVPVLVDPTIAPGPPPAPITPVLPLTVEQRPKPPARPDPAEPPGQLLWASGVESGDLSPFRKTPWNNVAAEDPRVVTQPTRGGRFALATTIPAGARTDDYGARSEIEPAIPQFRPGDDYYFNLSIYLDRGFPTDEEWQVVTQWKSELDGSPPLELNVEGGRFRLCGGEGHPDGARPFCTSLGPATTGRWIDWMFRVRLSPDPYVGMVQVWRDGAEVLGVTHPPGGTMYPDGSGTSGYLKMGYYRKSGIADAGTVYFDNISVSRAV